MRSWLWSAGCFERVPPSRGALLQHEWRINASSTFAAEPLLNGQLLRAEQAGACASCPHLPTRPRRCSASVLSRSTSSPSPTLGYPCACSALRRGTLKLSSLSVSFSPAARKFVCGNALCRRAGMNKRRRRRGCSRHRHRFASPGRSGPRRCWRFLVPHTGARRLHHRQTRSSQPTVALKCGLLS